MKYKICQQLIEIDIPKMNQSFLIDLIDRHNSSLMTFINSIPEWNFYSSNVTKIFAYD